MDRIRRLIFCRRRPVSSVSDMEFNWESGIINNKEEWGGGEGGGAEEVGFRVIYMASDHD